MLKLEEIFLREMYQVAVTVNPGRLTWEKNFDSDAPCISGLKIQFVLGSNNS